MMRIRRPGSIAASAVAVLCVLSACSSPSTPSSSNAAVPGASGSSAGSASATDAGPAPGASSAAASATASATASASPSAAASSSPPSAACSIFPANNIWHADIAKLPASSHSAGYVAAIGASGHLHPDFGSGLIDGEPFGIPVTTVTKPIPAVHVRFDYADESDSGPYLIPSSALVENGSSSTGDRHVIVYDQSDCESYELWDATRLQDGSWTAGSGAVFNLRSNQLRPQGWTSADAAGLSVLAGLVQYDEVASGHIDHAIRITVPATDAAYLWPARHDAGKPDGSLPPMGLRLRLKADVNISGLPYQARVIAQALQTYGAIVADNGSAWYIGGTQDSRWDNDQLSALKQFTGSDFEAVDTSSLEVSGNSGQAAGD
ncbi:MAG TPA: hypothetical protein VGX23_30780 [Actinocrinis sp.]|nr:hypothetical protein [Actinocrinis sp.]